jgi:DNA polymerase-3 subunit delta
MAILRASAVPQHLASNRLAEAYLVYGPDAGKVGDIARTLVGAIAGSVDDPFAVARLTDEAIAGDPQILADEVFSRPMLGSRKAVWVGPAGGAFAAAYDAIGQILSGGNVIVAEAGNLPKSAKLRTLFEKAATAQAIPCYEDDAEDLERLIEHAFSKARLTLSSEARAALLGYLGENRALSRAEIDKLILFCHGRGRATLSDVKAVCSGKTTAELSELTDAVFDGDLAHADILADRQLKAGVSGARLLGVAALHLPLLERLCLDVESGTPPAQAIRLARPPVFFSRQPSIARQLGIWDGESLSAAARALARAVQQTREFPALEDQIAERALLTVARMAAGRRIAR